MSSKSLSILSDSPADEQEWLSLRAFGLYRLLLVVLFASGLWGFGGWWVLGADNEALASITAVLFFAAATLFLWLVRVRRPPIEIQLTAQVFVDVAAVVVMQHTSGGMRSGLAILLLVPIVASALIMRGRMVFFHASVATIGLLVEQGLQLAAQRAMVGEVFQAGLMSVGFFIVAAVTSALARYARGAESIAEARGVDLANLSQINELVIRDMQDGFLVIDEDGRIRQRNPRCEAMLGRMEPDAILSEYSQVLAERLSTWRQDPDAPVPAVEGTQPGSSYQVRFVEVGSPIPGRNAPIVIFLEDLRRVRDQAQQLKLASLGRLTASIAHEIRNPLSSINHATELLLEGEERQPADTRLLNIIRDNAHRLDRMVEDVLYLNRRDRAQPQNIDLVHYLPDFAREFCGNERVPAEAIACELVSRRPVYFDRTHFDQILWNLARNAWRHGRKGPGSIHIRVEEDVASDQICVDVNDDGPGVGPAALPHLFEPFFTTDAQGTGLGLYIARELAEVNGAALEYVQRPAGATFRLRMRAAAIGENK